MRLLTAGLLSAVLAAPVWALKTERLLDSRYAVAGMGGGLEVASGVVLVKFAVGTRAEDKARVLDTARARILSEFDLIGWTSVGLADGMTVSMGLSLIKNLPGVVAAEPSQVYYASRLPNDPTVTQQYHLGKVNAYGAWDFGVVGANKVTIAVMDSGIQGNHPDLTSQIVAGSKSFALLTGAASADDPPTAACGHATQVAGVAAAATNNGVGVSGVGWGAQLISLKVFPDGACGLTESCAAGGCVTDEHAMIGALTYVHDSLLTNPAVMGKVVVNMSLGWGGTGTPPVCEIAPAHALQEAINAAYADGATIVVAAGNHGGDIWAPASCDNVIPVGATDENDNVASWSAKGSTLAANGVVAPGAGIRTTTINSGYTASATGTSFSAPIVAGIAALLLGRTPTLTPADVRNNIRASAEGIGVSSLGTADSRPQGAAAGAGRVNAFRAMRLLAKGTLVGWEGDAKAIAFPNPFKPADHGMVTITVPDSVRGKNPEIKIFTIDGQLVRDLGGNTSWNGKNDAGKPVATGTYIFWVKTDSGSETGRVAVVR